MLVLKTNKIACIKMICFEMLRFFHKTGAQSLVYHADIYRDFYKRLKWVSIELNNQNEVAV